MRECTDIEDATANPPGADINEQQKKFDFFRVDI